MELTPIARPVDDVCRGADGTPHDARATSVVELTPIARPADDVSRDAHAELLPRRSVADISVLMVFVIQARDVRAMKRVLVDGAGIPIYNFYI